MSTTVWLKLANYRLCDLGTSPHTKPTISLYPYLQQTHLLFAAATNLLVCSTWADFGWHQQGHSICPLPLSFSLSVAFLLICLANQFLVCTFTLCGLDCGSFSSLSTLSMSSLPTLHIVRFSFAVEPNCAEHLINECEQFNQWPMVPLLLPFTVLCPLVSPSFMPLTGVLEMRS